VSLPHAPATKLARILSPTLMTLILAACGGGGGGGPKTTAPQPASQTTPPQLAKATKYASGALHYDMRENTRHVAELVGDGDGLLDRGGHFVGDSLREMTTEIIRDVEISDDGMMAMLTIGTGARQVQIAYTIGGPDAHRLRFEKKDSTDAYLVFRQLADYEAASDQDGNNIFEINIHAFIVKYPDQRSFDAGNWLREPKVRIELSDVPDMPTTTIPVKPTNPSLPVLPTYSRQGDHIKITIENGKQAIFKLPFNKNITPEMNELIQIFLEDDELFDGDDGDKFTIARRNDGGPHLIISFTDPPNHERPTDTNEDNIYHFGIDDDLAEFWGDLTFEVMVTDNPLL